MSEHEWISDDTERKTLSRFKWRKLNYRTRYDRALGATLMALEWETSLCRSTYNTFNRCRVVGFGFKKSSSIVALEIKHGKQCMAERMRRWK